MLQTLYIASTVLEIPRPGENPTKRCCGRCAWREPLDISLGKTLLRDVADEVYYSEKPFSGYLLSPFPRSTLKVATTQNWFSMSLGIIKKSRLSSLESQMQLYKVLPNNSDRQHTSNSTYPNTVAFYLGLPWCPIDLGGKNVSSSLAMVMNQSDIL